MAQNKMRDPISLFGACKAVFYNAQTKELIGPPIRILESFSVKSDREQIDNTGGCSPYPYATANGKASAEGQMTFKEISPWMYSYLQGAKVTYTGPATKGRVGALIPAQGASIVDESTGIAIQALASSEEKIKFGMYSVKALTSNTIEVRAVWSELANNLVIATGEISAVNTALADYGLEVTEAGVTSLTVGDTAYFTCDPINKGSFTVVVGGGDNVAPAVGILIYRPNQDGYIEETNVFKAQFAGIPETITSNEFINIEANFKPLYSTADGGVYSKRVVSLNYEIEQE